MYTTHLLIKFYNCWLIIFLFSSFSFPNLKEILVLRQHDNEAPVLKTKRRQKTYQSLDCLNQVCLDLLKKLPRGIAVTIFDMLDQLVPVVLFPIFVFVLIPLLVIQVVNRGRIFLCLEHNLWQIFELGSRFDLREDVP